MGERSSGMRAMGSLSAESALPLEGRDTLLQSSNGILGVNQTTSRKNHCNNCSNQRAHLNRFLRLLGPMKALFKTRSKIT
jgi:hypothetical protein